MTKFKIILGTLLMGIGLWGCSNVSDDISPPMTQVSLQICGDKVIDNQIEKACYSNTTIYWGEISKDDIHLVKMTRGKGGKLDYYFVVVSGTGCVADLSAPIQTKTDLVALKSMFSENISGKLPEVKLSSFIEVEEKKRKLLIEETKEKLAFATLLGSQTTYTQPTCQSFRQIQQKLKTTGYKEIVYSLN